MIESKLITMILCELIIFIALSFLFIIGAMWGKYKAYEEMLESDIDSISDYLIKKIGKKDEDLR